MLFGSQLMRLDGDGERSGRSLCSEEAQRITERDRSESWSNYEQMFCNAPGRWRNWDLKFPVGCKPAWMWQGGPFIRAPNHCQRPVSGFQVGSASIGMPPGPWDLEDYLEGHINLAKWEGTEISGKLLCGRVCDLLALVAQTGWLSSLPWHIGLAFQKVLAEEPGKQYLFKKKKSGES